MSENMNDHVSKNKESSSSDDSSDSGDEGETAVMRNVAKSDIHKPVQEQPTAANSDLQDDEDSNDVLSDDNRQNTSHSLKLTEFENAWNKAIDVPEYEGQLMPSGMLQSAFTSAYTILRDQDSSDQAMQVMEIFAPKLEELAKARRFRTENLHCGAMSLIARSSSWEIHRQTLDKVSKVAVKIITDYENPAEIVKEVHTLLHVQHKGVVQLLGAFHDIQTHLVMPLFQGILGKNLSVLWPAQKVKFTIQLLQAVSFIHDKNILHLAISPSNIFVTQQNNAVLGNFGSSQLLPKGVQSLRVGTNQPILGQKSFNDAFANSRVYSKASDIFSLACTIYAIDKSEPLMEYENWDAPVEEYINVALMGRLTKIPPSRNPDWSGVNHGYNLDGDREPLLNRVKKSLFGVFLWDMAKHSFIKPAAAEILERQQSFFADLLRKNEITFTNLENVSDCGYVQQYPQNSEPPAPPNLSGQLNMALDNLYYDSNFKDASSEVSNGNDESNKFCGPVVPVNLLRKAVEELIQNSGKKLQNTNKTQDVPQPTAEQLTSVGKGTGNASTTLSTEALEKNETGRFRGNTKKPRTDSVVGTLEIPKRPKTNFKPIMPTLPRTPSTVQTTEKPGKETAKPAEKDQTSKPQGTSKLLPGKHTSKFSKAESTVVERSTGNQKSENSKPKRRARRAKSAAKDDQIKPNKNTPQKRTKTTDSESDLEEKPARPVKKGRTESTVEIDQQEGLYVEEDEDGYITDPANWVYRGYDSKPVHERGRPAPYKNIPEEMMKANNLTESDRGFLDCEICKKFYTVDYLEWKKHMSFCGE